MPDEHGYYKDAEDWLMEIEVGGNPRIERVIDIIKPGSATALLGWLKYAWGLGYQKGAHDTELYYNPDGTD